MGIQVEFNPDLALRETGTKERLEAECIPENLQAGRIYNFLKKGQRNYWLEGDIPLLITEGNQKLSRPLASISILEVTHFVKDNLHSLKNEVWTKGRYRINEIYDVNDPEIHFEGMGRVR